MKRFEKPIKAALAASVAWLPDAAMAAGAGAIAYGAWLVYVPAGFIVGGMLTVTAGVLLARGGE
ncbi:hypothetical protein D3C72_2305890 [compost metagenome]